MRHKRLNRVGQQMGKTRDYAKQYQHYKDKDMHYISHDALLATTALSIMRNVGQTKLKKVQ